MITAQKGASGPHAAASSKREPAEIRSTLGQWSALITDRVNKRHKALLREYTRLQPQHEVDVETRRQKLIARAEKRRKRCLQHLSNIRKFRKYLTKYRMWNERLKADLLVWEASTGLTALIAKLQTREMSEYCKRYGNRGHDPEAKAKPVEAIDLIVNRIGELKWQPSSCRNKQGELTGLTETLKCDCLLQTEFRAKGLTFPEDVNYNRVRSALRKLGLKK